MGEGFTILEILKVGELKYGSRPWYGIDIFWNRPMLI